MRKESTNRAATGRTRVDKIHGSPAKVFFGGSIKSSHFLSLVSPSLPTLACITDFTAYNGNVKEKPAPSKSQQTAGQASVTGENLFERCIYAMLLLREKRVVLSPMLERKAVCGK